MNPHRRAVLIGGAASLTVLSTRLEAQQPEVVVGALYPLSGASAQIGIDAKQAFETALDIVNNVQDLDLPLAKTAGLPGLGGAKLRLVYADHLGDPQTGRAEAERLITQDKVAAVIGCYHSAVSATASQTAERYGVPFMCADSSSPNLQRRGLKFFFRASPHDEMFSQAMFDMLDSLRKKGRPSRRLPCSMRTPSSAPIRRTCSSSSPRIAAIRCSPTSNIAPIPPRSPRRCSSSRPRMPTC